MPLFEMTAGTFHNQNRLLAAMTTSSFGIIFSVLYADMLPDPTINHSRSYLALGCGMTLKGECVLFVRALWGWSWQTINELNKLPVRLWGFSFSTLIKCLVICSEVYWFSAYLISLCLISENVRKSSLIKCYLLNVYTYICTFFPINIWGLRIDFVLRRVLWRL